MWHESVAADRIVILIVIPRFVYPDGGLILAPAYFALFAMKFLPGERLDR